MNVKKILITIFTLLLLSEQVILPVRAYASEQQKQELLEMIQEINETNSQLDAPQDSLNQFRYKYNNQKPKLTKEDQACIEEY